MRKEREWKNNICVGVITLVVFILVSFSGCAAGFLGISGGVSWKEEVVLHDGTKIVVERWQKHGGRHEPGQSSPISDQSISFTVPGTNKNIKWKDEASYELGGHANFILLALHIINNTAFIITTPYLSLSYSKWGNPNPPYIIFKYEGNEWKQIDIAQLPTEFKNMNFVIDADEKELASQSFVSAEMVKQLNDELSQKEYKSIIRTPMEGFGGVGMIHDGHGGWDSSGLYSAKPNYEACMKVCEEKKMTSEYCPCDRFFKSKRKEK